MPLICHDPYGSPNLETEGTERGTFFPSTLRSIAPLRIVPNTLIRTAWINTNAAGRRVIPGDFCQTGMRIQALGYQPIKLTRIEPLRMIQPTAPPIFKINFLAIFFESRLPTI